MVDQVGQYNIKLPNNYYQQNTYQGGLGDNLQDNQHVQAAKEQVSDSTAGHMMMGIPSTPEEWKKFTPYLASGLGASWLITHTADVATKGKFEDSFLYKVGQRIDNSSLVNGSASKRFSKWIGEIKNSVSGFFMKSDSVKKVVNTMKRGSGPTNGQAKGFLRGFIGQGVDELMEGFKNLPKSQLDDILKGTTDHTARKSIKEVIRVVDGIKNGAIENAAAYEQIAGHLKHLPLDNLKNITIAKEASFFNFWNFFGLAKNKKININKLVNKVKFLEGKGANSPIGRTFQKLYLKVADAMGGGVVGGSIGIVMNAFFLAQAFKQAKEAPKGEKVSTFMEEMFGNMIGGYLMMVPIGKFFHSLTGLKYLGVDKEAYQGAVKNLAERLKTCKINPEAYKTAADSIKAMGKANIKWYLKPLRFIGKILETGKHSIPAMSKSGKLWNLVKSKGGGIMRFAVIMLVLMPPVTKAFMKLSHMIFGKPTVSQVDKDYEEKMEARRKQREGITEPQKELSPNPKVKEMFEKLKETNKTNQTTNNIASSSLAGDNSAKAAVEKNPAAWSLNNSKGKDKPRTYIPSSAPAQFQAENQKEFAEALTKSDKYADYAEKVVKES